MKNTLLLCLCLIVTGALFAQADPFMNIDHSSRCADGNLRVRWDDLTGNAAGTECLYSTGGTWQNATSETMPSGRMQALVPYNYGQSLRYRMRSEMTYENETFVMMHAPYMAADTFPPSYNNMGSIGVDATGDSLMIYATTLDLTGTWFAATDTKIYSGMGNAAGSFPTFLSLTSYNVYGTTIANPETVVDTLFYAMIYTFNVAGIISPGLYKIMMGESGIPTFERLGNIQSQVAAGKLYMSCNIADLVNDPDFGPWPNMYNALAVASITMRLNVNLQTMEPDFGLGDYSTPAAIYFVDNHYQHSQNTLPVISNFQMSGNGPSEMSFEYSDADGDFPLSVYFETSTGSVFGLEPGSTDFSNSVTFTGTIPFLPESGTLFVSDNEIDFVEYEYGNVANPEDTQPVQTLQCLMPNPFRGGELQLLGLDKSPLTINVFNLRGQNLGTIYNGATSSETLSLQWDGKVQGRKLAGGIYILQAKQDGKTLTHKFILSE